MKILIVPAIIMLMQLCVSKHQEPHVMAAQPVSYEALYSDSQFKEVLAKCKIQYVSQGRFSTKASDGLARVEEAYLTNGEKRALGLFSIPSGATVAGQAGLKNVIHYASLNGEFPDSIFDLRPELLSKEEYSKFVEMSDQHKLFMLFDLINPITGSIYSTPNASSWSPGAFRIERLRYSEYVQRFGDPKLSCKVEPQAWRYMVFGEKPDTVIMDIVTATCDNAAVPWKGQYGKMPP